MLKRTLILLIISIITVSFSANWVLADGDGNIDNGGGGMGSGTSQNKWTSGYDGVRITVIRSSDKAVVSNPIDYTNKTLPNNLFHFGKVSKIQYQNHGRLTPTMIATSTNSLLFPPQNHQLRRFSYRH